MSSTISSTEVQTIVKKPQIFHHPMDDRRLVRTSSLEKIRRFNTYICSQQYYILPAILAWLRSSQPGLQASTETTIFFFRSLFFSSFIYKLYQVEFRALAKNVLFLVAKQIQRVYNSIETVYFLKAAVYLTAVILMTELCVCFYLLSTTYVPNGLIFLILCWFYIIYLNVRSVHFQKRTNDPKKKH